MFKVKKDLNNVLVELEDKEEIRGLTTEEVFQSMVDCLYFEDLHISTCPYSGGFILKDYNQGLVYEAHNLAINYREVGDILRPLKDSNYKVVLRAIGEIEDFEDNFYL